MLQEIITKKTNQAYEDGQTTVTMIETVGGGFQSQIDQTQREKTQIKDPEQHHNQEEENRFILLFDLKCITDNSKNSKYHIGLIS